VIGVEFTETITLGGVLLAVLVAVAGLATYAYGLRWKTAYEVERANAAAWEHTSARMEERIRALESEHGECSDQLRSLRARVAELESLPDLAVVMEAIAKHDQAVGAELRRHDEHAEKRAARIVAAIERLAAA
jgi:chromosome segregation ATPase